MDDDKKEEGIRHKGKEIRHKGIREKGIGDQVSNQFLDPQCQTPLINSLFPSLRGGRVGAKNERVEGWSDSIKDVHKLYFSELVAQNVGAYASAGTSTVERTMRMEMGVLDSNWGATLPSVRRFRRPRGSGDPITTRSYASISHARNISSATMP